MLIRKDTHGIYDRVGSEWNFNWMGDEIAYFIDTSTIVGEKLFQKILLHPEFEAVENENGELIDIIPIIKNR